MKFLALCLLTVLLSGCITSNVVKEVREERFEYRVIFCSQESCFNEIIQLISSSESVDCAVYNANDAIVNALENKKYRIVVSSDSRVNSSFSKKRLSGLMHNKFCIFDSKTVLTGSFNPTRDKESFDSTIIINSSYLVMNYEAEFEELWQGGFGKGKKTKHNRILLNTTLVENYFCPEDQCAERVKAVLRQANESIYFMSYVFTLKDVAEEMLRQNERGIEVAGIMENTAKYSVFEMLSDKIDVRKHGKGFMHHKVFIIDNRTVIIGSFNPTKNGNERNDENLLIIHNAEVAEKYLNEFNTLMS